MNTAIKNHPNLQDTIMRRKDVEAVTGLARSTIYAMVKNGKFPSPIPIGTGGHAVGWLSSEVNAFIQSAAAARGAFPAVPAEIIGLCKTVHESTKGFRQALHGSVDDAN